MGHVFLRQQKSLQIQVDRSHLLLFPNQELLTYFSKNKKEDIYVITDNMNDFGNIEISQNIHFFLLKEQPEYFTCGIFSVDTKGGLTISIGATNVFYDIGKEISLIPSGNYEIAFLDLDISVDHIYDLAKHIHPKIGVPIGSDKNPAYYIDVCRELMQRQLCVPKYLQSDQYLLFEE